MSLYPQKFGVADSTATSVKSMTQLNIAVITLAASGPVSVNSIFIVVCLRFNIHTMVGPPWVEHGTNGLWVHCSNQHELEAHYTIYTLWLYNIHTMTILYTEFSHCTTTYYTVRTCPRAIDTVANTTQNVDKSLTNRWQKPTNYWRFWADFGVSTVGFYRF